MITRLFQVVLVLSITASSVYLMMKALTCLAGNRLSQNWRCNVTVVMAVLFFTPLHMLWNHVPAAIPVPLATSRRYIPSDVQPLTFGMEAQIATQSPVVSGFDWYSVLTGISIIWVIGICVLLAWNIYCLRRFRNQIKSAVPAQNRILTQLALEQACQSGIRTQVSLLISPAVPCPMLTGFFRPIILLPSEQISPEDARLILAHELTHFRRNDLWKKLLTESVRILHWFNPIAHLLSRDFSLLMESACDEDVVSGLEYARRKEYGHLLINCSHPSRASASAFNTAFVSSRDKLERRIKTMLHSEKRSHRAISAALVIALTISSVVFSALAAEESNSLPEDTIPMAAVAHIGDTVTLSDANPDYEEIVIEGEIGEQYVVGDLIFEIVSPEEVQAAATGSPARASSKLWSVPLSGDSMSQSFKVTSSYPYAKVWVDNQGSGDIKFTITQSSPTGSVVSGSNITIAAGTATSIYSTNKWPSATYYANFTCGKANMAGSAACRVASTIEELDI